MTGSPPPARGVRLQWQAVPERVRDALEQWAGSRVVSTASQASGFSPGIAARVRLADGRGLFVKAAGPSPNPEAPTIHRREARIVAALLFGGAYAGAGWHLPALVFEPTDQAAWVPLLEQSAASLRQRLAGTPPAWLERRLEAMDQSGTLVGWRVLLLLVEHEVHHRSQLDTYAGLAGWTVPDLFGLSFEQVRELASDQP